LTGGHGQGGDQGGSVRVGKEREQISPREAKGNIQGFIREKGPEKVMEIEDQSKAEDWSG